jgi:hypothetical protein
MAEKIEDFLRRYTDYIEELAKNKSPQLFTNGGIEYASQLMAVLFGNTNEEARIFCQGFKPDLITTQPYWNALQEYLENRNKVLKVLVETDEYVLSEPLQLLKTEKDKRGDDTIQVKLATKETTKEIYDKFNGNPCNFAIFDDNKFRFENEPDGYKAFGSFNRKDYAGVLIAIFDEAFNKSADLNFLN